MNFDLDQLAAASGVLGFVLVALWPLLSGRRALLLGQAASAAAFILHYALLGAGTGAAVTTLSLIQAALAWPEDRPRWRAVAYLGTAPVLAILVALTWQGPASGFAAAGLAFATVGRWGGTETALRVPFALAAICWAVHDVLVSSWSGLGADIACMVTLAAGYLRPARRAAAVG